MFLPTENANLWRFFAVAVLVLAAFVRFSGLFWAAERQARSILNLQTLDLKKTLPKVAYM